MYVCMYACENMHIYIYIGMDGDARGHSLRIYNAP